MTDIWDWYRQRILFERLLKELFDENQELLDRLAEND